MHTYRAAVLVVLCAVASGAAAAQAPVASSFYGGVAIRQNGSEQGLAFGDVTSSFGRLAPLDFQPADRASAFGGYRFRRDFALEASIASSSPGYRLPGRGGVGLVIPALADPAARQWNVDVVGSWSFWRSLALYGRLGYAQSEMAPAYRTTLAGPERRTGDGLQYGVGLRYDFSRALGLKLEYARVGNHAGEFERSAIPEADQVQFGVQFRF